VRQPEPRRLPQGGKAVRLKVEAPSIGYKFKNKNEEIFRMAGSASVDPDGKNVTLTITHTHVDEPIEVELALRGGKCEEGGRTVLTHADIHAHNTFEKPDEVVAATEPFPPNKGRSICLTLPPHSITCLQLRSG